MTAALALAGVLSSATNLSINLSFFIIGFLGISTLVGLHELGHFFACKLFNVHTPSFSIGFGPRIFEKRIGETDFAFSLLPLGGYVEIAGLQEVGQGEQAAAHNKDERSFAAKPYYQKMVILFGGIFVNLVVAYFTITFLLVQQGLPSSALLMSYGATPVITGVLANSPAERAGLQSGDQIIALDGVTLPAQNSLFMLLSFLKEHASKEIQIEIIRNSRSLVLPVTLNASTAAAQLGASFDAPAIPQQGLMSALRTSASIIYSWMNGTFTSLRTMLQKRTTQGLGGPIAVVHGMAHSARLGISSFLLFLCFVSVGLACLNILPLPIFDGGQAVFYTLEAIVGRPLESARIIINYACWAVVLLAFIYLSWYDIIRIISGQ